MLTSYFFYYYRSVANIFYKGVQNSEDPYSADTNSLVEKTIDHHIAIMRAIQYMIIHIIL